MANRVPVLLAFAILMWFGIPRILEHEHAEVILAALAILALASLGAISAADD